MAEINNIQDMKKQSNFFAIGAFCYLILGMSIPFFGISDILGIQVTIVFSVASIAMCILWGVKMMYWDMKINMVKMYKKLKED